MFREIESTLADWKTRLNRKPMIIRGARQVGKTFVVEQFAKNHFSNFIKLNLEEKPELRKLFDKHDSKLILNEISVIFNTDVVAGTTLLFIDEIQFYPAAIQTLRYFYEQIPDLHIIAAGSLLDFTLSEMQYSMPVGRVEFVYLYPLNFNEFLCAVGQKRLSEYLKSYDFETEFSPVLHAKILESLRLYFFIGGMPEVVKAYVETGKLTETERIQNNITTSLIYDFAKYGSRKQQEYMAAVLQYSAQNIGRKVKYASVNKEIRSTYLKDAFLRLEQSRVLHLASHTNASNVPLTQFVSSDTFKPIFLDIGLANHFNRIQLIDIDKLTTQNEGMLAEQFIGQEIIAAEKTYLDSKLFYWMREEKNSNAEIDYIIQINNVLYPIEVKAGKTGTLKSLQQYLVEKKQNIGIRFNTDLPSAGNFSVSVRNATTDTILDFKLISLPLYLCSELPRLLAKLP